MGSLDSGGAAGKSAESLPIPASRRRSNSCAVDPFQQQQAKMVAQEEDVSVPSLEQRIEQLKYRVANSNVEVPVESFPGREPVAPTIHVGSIVENFERLSKKEQAANIDYRIERLKRDVSRVIQSPHRRSSVESLADPSASSRDLSRESSAELRESETGIAKLPDILGQALSQIQPLPNSALTKQDLLQRLRGTLTNLISFSFLVKI